MLQKSVDIICPLYKAYEYIEKLQKAHVDYRVFEDQETVYSRDKRFIFRINAADLKKVS